MNLPSRVSAIARKRLGDLAHWDEQTELQASTVDLMQVMVRILQGAYTENPPTDQLKMVPRPYPPQSEPEKTVGLDGLTDFLKG
jgi:hypothetical protein